MAITFRRMTWRAPLHYVLMSRRTAVHYAAHKWWSIVALCPVNLRRCETNRMNKYITTMCYLPGMAVQVNPIKACVESPYGCSP